MTHRIKKLPGGIIFLFGVIILYLIAIVFSASFAWNSFVNFVQNFIALLPIFLFVFVVIFIVNLFLKPEKIKKHLGHDSGIRGWLYAALASVFIASPPYVIFPLLGQLKKHGMKYSLMAVFLGNRNVQPAFLPVMVYYFGLTFTMIISVYILAFSILNGIIIGKVMKEKKYFDNMYHLQ